MASPSPPITEWFSATTTRRPVANHLGRIVASSSGLIVGHVQHRDIDAVGIDLVGDLERAHRHEAARDHQHAVAFAHHLGLAQLELVSGTSSSTSGTLPRARRM